jgi:aminoglycoside phosphotransferase (APT) family kinase protein
MIDIENADELVGYLHENGHIGPGEKPILRTLRGGVSNKTVWLRRDDNSAWVLKQALPKLRVPSEWFSDPARIRVEAEGLRYLPSITSPGSIPVLVFEDTDQHILAMEAVPEPNQNWKERLLGGDIDAPLIRQFGQLLGMIHRKSAESRQVFASIFKDRRFFETLRLEPYYEFSARQIPAAADFLLALTEEVRHHCDTLVHGDYSPKNVLIHAGRLVLLDHEVLHFGDPAFDLGFSLTHLLSKAIHLPPHRASLLSAAAEYWRTYAAETREAPWFLQLEGRAARNTVACLLARVAGRSQLEYLSSSERLRQRTLALQLVNRCPVSIPDLIKIFSEELRDG